jgi:hypothetical protein
VEKCATQSISDPVPLLRTQTLVCNKQARNVIILFYNVFNDASSVSDYIAPNESVTSEL